MRSLGVIMVASLLCACATETAATTRRRRDGKLVVAPKTGVLNQSQRLNTASSRRPRSLMLLGPDGVGHVQPAVVERELERRFLAATVAVITPAITGRVVAAPKNEDSDHLTTLERAMVLARQSNADVIVQLEAPEAVAAQPRHFCSDGRHDFRECSEADSRVISTNRTFVASEIRLRGRVIETTRGEIVATVDLRTAIADWLDVTYSDVDLNTSARRYECATCSASYCGYCAAAEARAWNGLLETLVQHVATTPLRDDAP